MQDMQEMSQLVQQMSDLGKLKEERLASRLREKDTQISILQSIVDDYSEAQVGDPWGGCRKKHREWMQGGAP